MPTRISTARYAGIVEQLLATKLGVESRTQAIRGAHELDLVGPRASG